MKKIIDRLCKLDRCTIDDCKPGDIIAFKHGNQFYQLVRCADTDNWYFVCMDNTNCRFDSSSSMQIAIRDRIRFNRVDVYKFDDVFDLTSWIHSECFK